MSAPNESHAAEWGKVWDAQGKEIPDVHAMCRDRWPHGHPDFISLTLDEMQLHSEKNHDYAKGGNPLGNFNRVASILALYPGLSLAEPVTIALVYALKQLDAVLWMLSQGYEGTIEGIVARLRDVSIYMKLAMLLRKGGPKHETTGRSRY